MAGAEHKRLHRPGFNIQFDFHVDSDGVRCLRFTDDAQSNTNQGGLLGKYHAPKVGHAYPNVNPARCIIHLFDMSINLLPSTQKNASLYIRPKRKIQPKQWYNDIGLGINTIGPIV